MQQYGPWSLFLLTFATLARLVEGIPVSGSTSPVDCSRFGPSASGKCVEYTGYPTQINGINVDLYRYVDGWTTPNPTGDLNIAAIRDALPTILPLFSTFSSPFSVDIALIKSFKNISNTNLAEATAVLPAGTPCSVLIIEQPNNGMNPSFNVEHVTTHELYHCVQIRNQGNDLPDLDGSGWWIEGSAEYFANRFYQKDNPKAHFKLYKPSVALYSQNAKERAGLFWQFLSSQGWDDKAINSYVMKLIQDAQVGGSERAIMSHDADLQRLFPIFAQKFSGLAITFPDGSLAQGNPGTPISETVIVLDDLKSDGQQHPTQVDIPSFTMKLYTATLRHGITYSIQWAPSTQDGRTVLAYQAGADVSGNTEWTTLDPVSPIQITIDCSAVSVQYKFLLTSTADEDVSHGQLTFVRQSSQFCSCDDVGISLDPCLSGNWNLDLNRFQTYLQSRMNQVQGAVVTNLVASGASTFEFPGGGMGGMTFSALTMSYDLDVDLMTSHESMHTTTTLTGSVSGKVVMQAAGKFCWADGRGQGHVSGSTTAASLGGPIEFDGPLSSAYVSPTIAINYTCSATSLQLEAYDYGLYVWALSYVKA